MALSAQDSRQVTEPHYPAACATLDADAAANQGVLAPQDETKLSTDRIQRALDACPAGKAVVLRAKSKNNVFLTGPLMLRAGVTLVDMDTLLRTSDYGVVAERGHGCKPLILGDGAKGSGIMGEGSIDGRGGAKLLGQDVSWWDLAHQAKITDKQQSVPVLISLRHADNFTM